MTEPSIQEPVTTSSDRIVEVAPSSGNTMIANRPSTGNRLLSSQVGKSVSTFWRWWMAELKMLLPPSLRRILEHNGERIVIEFDQQEACVALYSMGHKKLLGCSPVAPDMTAASPPPALTEFLGNGTRDTIVCLPRQQTLQTTISLPIEAAGNLREVLGYEIDRQTPFKSEQVYFDAEIIERKAGNRYMRIRLTVVPRKILDSAVKTARDWGLQPAVVSTGEYDQPASAMPGTSILNLLPPEHRSRTRGPWTPLSRLLAISALGLAIAAITLPLIRQTTEIRKLEMQIEADKIEAEATLGLRNELDRLVPESRFILEQKQQTPVIVEVVNELSLILPDDTWIQRFQLSGSKLTIQGESSAASALIRLLENSSMFQNATFITAVAHNPKTGQERFQITATVVMEKTL